MVRRRMKTREERRQTRIRELAEALAEDGWEWSPLVVHGDEVLGGLDHYEAARYLGIDDGVPRVTLEEVFAEAGLDMPDIATPDAEDPHGEFYEDYLRELPRHIRDKYEI